MEQFEIIKIKGSNKEIINDTVTEEISLTIDINDNEIATLLCSKENLYELTLGYLFSSDIIKNIENVKNHAIFSLVPNNLVSHIETKEKILFDKKGNKKVQAVGCGTASSFIKKGDYDKKINSDIRIKTSKIIDLMRDFQSKSEIFLKTGGVHSAAIVENSEIVVFREDIGRHNAIDKVIGNLLINKLLFNDKILLTSGRISSEILHKVIMCKIPILISRSAPTNKAIQICRKLNITLIGFVRGNKMNIYSGEQRIIY